MTTEIYVAKYIPDTRRWEPVNVGVIIFTADGAAGRFLGETPSGSDHRVTRHVVGDPNVYDEWLRYWRRAIHQQDRDAIATTNTFSYWVARAGEIWLEDEPKTPERLAADFYQE